MTFYLKYRSQMLEELDLEEVRESLKRILSSGKIPHAFIFSGPKGSGKTSAARILAKIVNCENLTSLGEPCNRCSTCLSIMKGENLDVIELDAASHRGIDDVRAIRDAVKLATTRAKKKVYIIDEAHMLTVEASNALLKTLEEPPEHVIFILATTNPEKLIPTIRSRATEIIFRKAKTHEIVRALKRILEGEKLEAEEGVLELIAQNCDGSFRDAAKILEQIILEGRDLKKDKVSEFLFGRRTFEVDDFLEILAKRDVQSALNNIEKAVSQGVAVKVMITALISRLRSALLSKLGLEGEDLEYFSKEEIIRLIKLFDGVSSQIPFSVLEQVPLEVAAVEWCQDEKKEEKESQRFRILDKGNKTQDASSKSKKTPKIDFRQSENDLKPLKKAFLNRGNSELSEELWRKVLTQIRPNNASTEALLRAAKPLKFDGNTLTLGVYYRFHKEHLEVNPHRDLLEKVLHSVLGHQVRVRCVLSEMPNKIEKYKETGVVLTEPKIGMLTKDKKTNEEDLSLTEEHDQDIIEIAKEIFGS